MSREEHLTELVRQGQALRQEDIDLGAKQEQERIIKLLDDLHLEVGQIAHIANRLSECKTCQAIALIKGENK